jgi:hypothetical protein
MKSIDYVFVLCLFILLTGKLLCIYDIYNNKKIMNNNI